MPKTKQSGGARPKAGEPPEPKSRVGTALKWVGGATAVLSLVFGVRQLVVLVSEFRDRQRQTAELIAIGKLERDARNYRSAWTSLSKAAALRANDAGIHAAQEDLAMAWLDDIRGSQGAMAFTPIVDSLVPVLSRGVVGSEGSRKADLLAHLGWADFLRWRDGQRAAEPGERYRQALAVDSQNVFAHSMLAHWLLWNQGSTEEAGRHFAAALRSGRERPYVRRLQLAALANMSDDAGDLEIVRVANDMRRANEPIDPTARDRIWDAYYARLVSPSAKASSESLFAAVPPGEQLATYRWVFENSGYLESKGFLYEYAVARLQDAAGEREQALATYRSIRSKLPPNASVRGRVDSAIARLATRR